MGHPLEGSQKKGRGRRPKAANAVPSRFFFAPPTTMCLIILLNFNSQGKGSKRGGGGGGQETWVSPYLVPNVQPDAQSVSQCLSTWAGHEVGQDDGIIMLRGRRHQGGLEPKISLKDGN